MKNYPLNAAGLAGKRSWGTQWKGASGPVSDLAERKTQEGAQRGERGRRKEKTSVKGSYELRSLDRY